jgi:hypothetical protein
MLKRYIQIVVLILSIGCPIFGQDSGPANQNTAPSKRNVQNTNTNQPDSYDPLAFYRRNPELMKRYFPHLYAQNNTTSAAPNVRQKAAEPAPPPDVIPVVKFDGGTARELVDVLKTTIIPTPNIMVAEKTAQIKVPPFQLQNVSLADLFQALNALSEDKTAQWQLSGSAEPIWVLNETGASIPPSQRYGFPMSVDPLTGQPLITSGPNKQNCQVLPVGKYLTKYKIEDITTAVKTAWGMMGQESGAQLKYHKDTDLLMVVGSPEQLSILNQVLSSLDTGMRDNPAPKTTAKTEAAQDSPHK